MEPMEPMEPLVPMEATSKGQRRCSENNGAHIRSRPRATI